MPPSQSDGDQHTPARRLLRECADRADDRRVGECRAAEIEQQQSRGGGERLGSETS